MSIKNPVWYIDGTARPGLSKRQTNKKGKAYFAHSPKGSRYGIKVSAKSFPNGLATEFSLGTVDNEGQKVVTSVVKADQVIGKIEHLSFEGQDNMTAYVSLHKLNANEFNLVTRVSNPATGKTYTLDEVSEEV